MEDQDDLKKRDQEKAETPDPGTEQENPNAAVSGFENLAGDKVLAKKAEEFCGDMIQTLKRKRLAFEPIWAECNDAFRCVERKTWFQGAAPYCSSDLRDAALTIIPKIAKAVWYQDIPFELIPIGEEGEDDKLVDINKKVLEWDFRNLRLQKKYIDYLFQKGIFGTGIVKTPPHWELVTKQLRAWREMPYGDQTSKPGKRVLDRKQENERVFMGTDFIVTDLFDFWIDPQTVSRGKGDAVEYGDCAESIVIKQTDLWNGQKRKIYLNLEEIEDDYIGASGKRPVRSRDSGYKQRVKEAGHVVNTSGQSAAALGMASIKSGNKLYEIREFYADFDIGNGPERFLIVIAAEKKCIRLQRWPGNKPYLTSRYTPNGYNKEFYGTGIIETNLSNHYERNATRKQALMARTMGLNMEMLSDQTGFANKPDKLRTAPNKVHFVKNINGVKPFEKPIAAVLQSALAWEQNLKSETQQSTGNTPYVGQGGPTKDTNDTARGIALLQSAGNEKFYLPTQMDESEMLEPYVKRCLENNVTYRTESFIMRLTDKKPIRVRPEDLSANFDVYSLGSSELQNKVLRQQALDKFYAESVNSAQLETMLYGMPLTDFYELKKEIAANAGLSNPENFIKDPATIQGGPQTQLLTPEHKWILARRMAEGVVPLMPIMIQPGEDIEKQYQELQAKTLTEEFDRFPDQVKQIWFLMLGGYEKVLKFIESREKEKINTKAIEAKEVAAGV